MQERQRNGFNAGHLLLALMGGAIAGAGVAYLTAPSTGAETRHRMRLMAHDTNLAVQRMPGAVRRASEAARDAFVSALELEQYEEEEEETTGRRRGQKAVTAKAGKTRRG
jgi:gas vesicle protein